MKKLKRILLDDFEQLSASEAAQFVGGMGSNSSLPGGVSTSTDLFGSDITNDVILRGVPLTSSNSGTWGGGVTNNGNGSYNGSINYSYGNVSGGISYNGNNDSYTYSAGYKYGNASGGVSYNSNSDFSYSAGYKYGNASGGVSYNSNSDFTYSAGYKYGNASGGVSYNNNSGFTYSVGYKITF